MKNFLRIKLSSLYILTCVLFGTLFISLLSPKVVFAACTPSSGTCGSSYSCVLTKNSTTTKFCCGNQAECTAEKANTSSTINTSGNVTKGSAKSGVLKVDPEAGCAGGVSTALGCIPYNTEGFTGALLGFLAGVVGLIALVVMLIATIMIMTGGANPEQVKKGKELFTGGISGLFFIVFSVTLLRIIAGDIIKLPGF